jgi:hypothetical protein
MIASYSRRLRKPFFPPPIEKNNTGLRITEYPLYPGSGAKAGEAIRVPQTSISSHPEIMPDFFTLEIVKSPSYSDPFSCYFHPLEKEKSLYFK